MRKEMTCFRRFQAKEPSNNADETISYLYRVSRQGRESKVGKNVGVAKP